MDYFLLIASEIWHFNADAKVKNSFDDMFFICSEFKVEFISRIILPINSFPVSVKKPLGEIILYFILFYCSIKKWGTSAPFRSFYFIINLIK